MKNGPLIVAAALSVLASGALAQTRVDRSGATDASNRVGSNGRNQVGGRETPWDIQNRIVYGNVTGGKAFRGGTASTDPQAFRGQTGSDNSDRFIRNSSGVTTGGVPTYNANETRAFYGDARGVAPPAGTVGVTTVGGYSPPVPNAWRNVDPRTGAVSSGDTVAPLNRADTAVAGGAVDTQYAPNVRSAVPQSLDGLSDYTDLNTTNLTSTTPAQIKQNQADTPDSKLPGQSPTDGTTNFDKTAVPAGGTPTNNAKTGSAADQSPAARTPTAGGAVPLDDSANPANAPEAGTVTRFVTRTDQPVDRTAAGQAAAAKAEAATVGLADKPGGAAELAAKQYTADSRKRQATEAAEAAKTDKATGVNKPDADNAAKPQTPPAGQDTKMSDADINRGVGDLLTKAQTQTKEGKFVSAIDIYSAAEAVAPRSGTVKLGKANAELGGAFYVKAEKSLRSAFAVDKSLLAGQHDLRGFLGDDRLANVQRDLSDLVQNKPTDTGAAVLLAYVYYNTGNEGRVAALLDVADKRAGGRDPLVKAMQSAWKAGADDTK